MILYLHIPPWGSLPVYTEAPRWPEPQRLPLPPRQLALDAAARTILKSFMESEDAEAVREEALRVRQMLIARGEW